MPFCPNCETEYKGHVSVCPECGERLIEADLDELEELDTDELEEEYVLLYRSTSRSETDELSEALREEGIAFSFRPAGSASPSGRTVRQLYSGGKIDGEFYVGEEDYDDARQVVESLFGEVDEDLL